MSIDYISLLPDGYTEDPQRGPVYLTPPHEVDDLTEIHGIGEVLEAQLNLNGVYRLEQIAGWEQENIAAFSELMPCFQDRIERNYWILQSQRIIERRQQAERSTEASGSPSTLMQTIVVMSLSLVVGLLLVRWLAGGTPQTYAGYLRARTFHAAATTTGDVARLLVGEGDQVLENDEIVRLRDTALSDAREAAEAHAALLQSDVDQAVARAELDLKWRLREIDKEILEHRNAIARIEGHNSRSQNPRIEPLVPATTASLDRREPWLFFNASGNSTLRLTRTSGKPSSAPDDLAPTTAAEAQLSLARQRIDELEKLKAELNDSVQRAGGVQSARSACDRAKQALEQLKVATGDVSITSSGFGIVSKCLRREGDHVTRGEPVLELVDSREQYVAVMVPSQEVDGVHAGMKVSLYFPGNQHRRGRIASLPIQTSNRQPRSSSSAVEIRIEPMGALWPAVPIGSEVRVAIDR